MEFKQSAGSWLIISLLLLSSPVFTQDEHTSQDYPSLEYERTEIRRIHSEIVGQDFELWISLPKSYSRDDSRLYPVIYLMDPYRGFAMVKGLTDVLTSPFQYIQEVIIVGVGYGGSGPETMLKWALGRTRDLTPVASTSTEELYRQRFEALGVHDVQIQTGGAPRFLDFLSKELIPFVESSYRIDSNERMLSGSSLGGLFGLYALFHAPHLFSKYFIGSPSLHYKDEITYSYESSYASQNKDLNAEVFMSAGSLEESTSRHVRQMEELLLSRNFENLTLKTVIFENESHVSCFPGALSRALIELLSAE